jgi:murein DD-endopeptidase MepM/ murein hydrolase activator NlpD
MPGEPAKVLPMKACRNTFGPMVALLPFVCPFLLTPDWGAMTCPSQWDRTHSQYQIAEQVEIPQYDLAVLTVPMNQVLAPRNIATITAKLFYSTRYMGTYDVDAGEYTGGHRGIDMKQPLGTPIRAVGSGVVHRVRSHRDYGDYIAIRHGEGMVSLYGHLGETYVERLERVEAGQIIGTVGMTGKTTAPHLHLEMFRSLKSVNPMDYLPWPCR